MTSTTPRVEHLKTTEFENDGELADWLLTPEAVRTRCGLLYDAGVAGDLEFFSVDESKLEEVAAFVAKVTTDSYPNLDVPPHSRWRHFEFNRRDLWAELANKLDAEERLKAEVELAITSVLLDAGAGAKWAYQDKDVGQYARSEGLAIASLRMYASGAFSSKVDEPFLADSAALKSFNADTLASGFQVSSSNPLEGLAGRAKLIQSLGNAIEAMPAVFSEQPRLGNLADYLLSLSENNKLPARLILITILHALGRIWAGRISLAGRNLGDTWQHPLITDDGLIPFHKLSQWLSYSLIEPLERYGVEVTNLDALTGLAEYRNGGLFIDFGVIGLKDVSLLEVTHAPDSQPIVEWRALTVMLLDKTATQVREILGKSEEELPLASILQGGTWAAGRLIAKDRREGGGPPIAIISDGSVF